MIFMQHDDMMQFDIHLTVRLRSSGNGPHGTKGEKCMLRTRPERSAGGLA